MSFFQTVTPAQPAPAPGPGLPPRPMPLAQAGRGQAVTILLPDGVPRFAGHTLSELFQAANQLISTAAHEVELRALSDCPGGDPAYWRGRQAVFLGDIQTPWRCARRQWQRAQQIITLAQGSVLVGGAVFLVEGSTHAAQQPLAIHANFALAAAEAGLMAPARPALFLDRGRVHSAVSPLAAVMLMLAHIARLHGDYAASALAGYVGLDDSPELARSPIALDIRRRSGGDRVVGHCLDLMEQHLEVPRSIGELAQALHVSPRQLQRRFMSVLEDTPLAVYRVLRAEKAHELLTHTSLPLAEVALATGFATPSHLTRCVKLVYHATPRELRSRAFRLS